eukprot:TRINITY_DN4021_c0_g1_i1.p1 TRINITY_DN4021_c0_g1~~TRINITY_DN4021_c0_g1_i1.p1  ORF type:complete len:102 (-),score=39.12 TRINITY_DN4021_c0_g1_i1:214-519(-)
MLGREEAMWKKLRPMEKELKQKTEEEEQVQDVGERRSSVEEMQVEKERLEALLNQNKEWIRKLHKYNDVKDMCQMLLGKLAVVEKCTLKDLYQRYDLELED